jgi:hypothetical protein
MAIRDSEGGIRLSVVIVLALALTSVLVGQMIATAAQAPGSGSESAQKTGAAASDLDDIQPDGAHVVLQDVIKASSAQDAIITVSSECSILTSLITGDNESTNNGVSSDTAMSTGTVDLYVVIDGHRVPISFTDPGNQGGPTGDDGDVTFCNRTYQRTVQDRSVGTTPDEGDDEGEIDVERDYIRTRNANAFSWLAKDLGFDYDETTEFEDANGDLVTNGNNILLVQVVAEYDFAGSDDPNTPDVERCPTATGTETTCSEAFVGSRTLIIEPTNVDIDEQVTTPDGAGS